MKIKTFTLKFPLLTSYLVSLVVCNVIWFSLITLFDSADWRRTPEYQYDVVAFMLVCNLFLVPIMTHLIYVGNFRRFDK